MSGGGLKITKIKQTFSGKVEETFLGELSLLDVNEGSMNIYIGYEIKKDIILQILVTSEKIMMKKVKHAPILYHHNNNLNHLFSKHEDTSSKMIIGSHVGINNYNQDSIQKILFSLQCNPFGGMKTKLGEKYIIEISNDNNEATLVFTSSGVEITFSREPETTVNEIFDIFKEQLITFNILKNVVSTKKVQYYKPLEYEKSEVKNWNDDDNINYSKNNNSYLKKDFTHSSDSEDSDFSPFSLPKFILFLFFLFLLFQLSIALFSR